MAFVSIFVTEIYYYTTILTAGKSITLILTLIGVRFLRNIPFLLNTINEMFL